MIGPKEPGHWTGNISKDQYQHLVVGQSYGVTRPFKDYDNDIHDTGERWTFLGATFLPHEDGLSLFVSLDGSQEWHVRLQHRPDHQAHVIDALGDYVTLVG